MTVAPIPELPPAKPFFVFRLLRALPIVGYVLRCFEEERVTELLWIAVVFLQIVILSLLVFGWSALITLALTMTATAGLIILSATVG